MLDTVPYGRELFLTELSSGEASQHLVADIFPGEDDGIYALYGGFYPDKDAAALLPDGRLVFAANDGVTGQEPWISDGTETGTVQLLELNDYNYIDDYLRPEQFVAVGDDVAFTAWVGGGGSRNDAMGNELVMTDGTEQGTRWFDIAPGAVGSEPDILGVVDDRLYFIATTGAQDGKEIFVTDGNEPEHLVDISDTAELLGWNDAIAYFRDVNATHGKELWAADLQTGEFSQVKDILPGSGSALAGEIYEVDLVLVGDRLVFSAYTSVAEKHVFISDGSEAGTLSVAEMLPANEGGQIEEAFALSDMLMLESESGIYAVDLSTSDYDVEQLVEYSVDTYRSGQGLQPDSDQAFFVSNEGELTVYDADSGEASALVDDVQQFKVLAEDAVYATQQTDQASYLWYSDGTQEGTRLVAELTGNAQDYDLVNAVGIKTQGEFDSSLL